MCGCWVPEQIVIVTWLNIISSVVEGGLYHGRRWECHCTEYVAFWRPFRQVRLRLSVLRLFNHTFLSWTLYYIQRYHLNKKSLYPILNIPKSQKWRSLFSFRGDEKGDGSDEDDEVLLRRAAKVDTTTTSSSSGGDAAASSSTRYDCLQRCSTEHSFMLECWKVLCWNVEMW